MTTPFIVSIEGNIGSGKSSIVRKLKEKYDSMEFIDEPVEDWFKICDNNKNNILDLFYLDKTKYSFCFQILAFISRIKKFSEIIKTTTKKIIITERSIFTDRYVFAKMLYDSKLLSDIEWRIYLQVFEYFKSSCHININIYINTDPNKCLERINKRNRSEEKDKISIEYLNSLHSYHVEWIKNTKKIIIDNNNDLDQALNDISQFFDNLKLIA